MEIHYEELVHMIMEALKFYNLLTASWKFRKISGVIPLEG